MSKRSNDEIENKLAELEVAMRHEQAVKRAEQKLVAGSADDKELLRVNSSSTALVPSRDDLRLEGELYWFGGLACITVGLLMVLSHIHVGFTWGTGLVGGMGSSGLMLLPLFAGIGMLIYNYRSRIAQLLTVSSLGFVIFTVVSRINLTLAGSSLLDLLLLALPICAGAAMLAKANDKKRQLTEQTKQV